MELRPGLRGEVRLPGRAEVRVLRNGEVEWSRETQVLCFPVERDGAYRVEVYRDGRPWIFSNPIYVTAPA